MKCLRCENRDKTTEELVSFTLAVIRKCEEYIKWEQYKSFREIHAWYHAILEYEATQQART
jgi:transcriptional regulator NrdR family protein